MDIYDLEPHFVDKYINDYIKAQRCFILKTAIKFIIMGFDDEWISKHIEMTPDEIKKLRETLAEGFNVSFQDSEYSIKVSLDQTWPTSKISLDKDKAYNMAIAELNSRIRDYEINKGKRTDTFA